MGGKIASSAGTVEDIRREENFGRRGRKEGVRYEEERVRNERVEMIVRIV